MKSSLNTLQLKRSIITAFLCSVLFVCVNLLLYTDAFKNIGQEDGVAENIGAVSFFLTSILFFKLFLAARKTPTPKEGRDLGGWYWFLALALLFFFVAGEEISWGQRIFGWATPDWMRDSNVQEETTIHNLEIFNAHTKEHELKPFWQSLITMNRMFSLFWLAWCFCMPLAMAFSAKLRQLVAFFGVPIPRFFYGCLFLATYIAAKSFVIVLQPEELIIEFLDEIKESFYAVIFLAVALNFVKRSKSQTEQA
ncbi:hypothetical protein NT6N_03530 [Oceaniferula spumae]|uniref:DUF4386 domain-containing protein n=1 Tax=Oceaniferula spumae TaxID=2979115 RepID=A0AAT9FH32_9BACT